MTQDVFLITIFGPDNPAATSELMAELARHRANVLDIGQAVIHDNLNLGILAEVDAGCAEPMRRGVIDCLRDSGLQAAFAPISPASYGEWVAHQGKPRHIVTLLARGRIAAESIARITAITAEQGQHIDLISRLSGRVPLDGDGNTKSCVEFSLRGGPKDMQALRSALLELATEMDVDIAYQEDTIFRRHRRLAVFDMDSTLIEAEVIDELAREAGVGDQVAAITAAAMRGEIDFKESFTQRVALLQGLSATVLDKVAKRIPLTEGARLLFTTLKKLGYRTAILSGGFNYFGRLIQQELGIDYVYANELDIVDGVVTGKVKGDIVDGPRKAALLKEIAAAENIHLEQVVAVGDGANDLPMLSIAGLGIAFRAKPIVKASAKQAISSMGLDAILYLMGIRDREV